MFRLFGAVHAVRSGFKTLPVGQLNMLKREQGDVRMDNELRVYSFTHAVHGMLPPVPKKPSTHWHVLEPTVLTVLTGQLEGVNMLESMDSVEEGQRGEASKGGVL